MNISIINKKSVKKNPAMKAAQKEAKKYYGFSFGGSPKGKINKVVSLKRTAFVANSFCPDRSSNTTQKISTSAELIEALKLSGLTGLSGNGFPVYAKMEALLKAQTKECFLIINGVECDPGLIQDYFILHNHKNELIRGIELLKQCFSFAGIYLVSKEKLPYDSELFSTVKVPNRYPMGYEHFLIERILGKTFDKNDIPATHGVLTINVQTLLAISNIATGQIFDSRYITVADIENGIAFVTKAKLGTDASSLMREIIADCHNKTIYIGGGAMNCHPLLPGEVITGETNFIGYGKAPAYEAASGCKGCGGCTSTCPVGVKVHKIVQAVEKGQTTGFEEYHPEKCIGCGCCTYGCMAQKNVMEIIAKINGNAK